MSYDDWYEWEGEQLNQHAVYQLVEKHRDEYEELAGIVVRDKILDLERVIAKLRKEVADLHSLNPHGTNVPALEQTVALQEKENLRLLGRKRRGK